MKNLIKDPQIARLTFQITLVSVTLILASFLTETQIWYDYFNYESHHVCFDGKGLFSKCPNKTHLHWNYRGWVYFFTGLAYFVISVVRMAKTFLDEKIDDYSVRDSVVKAIIRLEKKPHLFEADEQELTTLRNQLIKLDEDEKK